MVQQHAQTEEATGASLPQSHVAVRQWVLSLPIPLRLLLAAHPRLVTRALRVVHRDASCSSMWG
ncbi:MAG: hypothetical protein ABIN08_07660 [Caldimonas sp.]